MSEPNTQIKQRQRWLIGGAVAGVLGLVAVGLFLFDSGPKQVREKPKTVSIPPPGSVEDKDAWRAQAAAREKATENLIQEVRNELKAQQEKSAQLAHALEAVKANPHDQQNTITLNAPLPPEATRATPLLPPLPAGSTGAFNTPAFSASLPASAPPKRELEMIRFESTGASMLPADGGSHTEVVGFPVDEQAKRYKTTSSAGDSQREIEFIPAGSFVRVAMLNGVDAPTGGQAQSNPLPVAFHVLDTANLANRHRLNIKDCRFIAAAWGDLSAERMMARTESLTCIINGETVEMAVKGQVIGEDGKAGVRGRLVTKQGQLLAHALFAGALSGIGQAFQQSATLTSVGAGGLTQTLDPNKISQAVLGGGAGSAANMLAQYYLKAADKLFPVIETDGGRTVEILITKGAMYRGHANVRRAYRGLLRRSSLNRGHNEN